MRNLYLHRRFFLSLGGIVFLAIIAYVVPGFYFWVMWGLCLFGVLVMVDALLLYGSGHPLEATREMAVRFSNGEDNPVLIRIFNHYPFTVRIRILDEVPVDFQKRDLVLRGDVPGNAEWKGTYTLRPVRRGVYEFGQLRVFVRTRLSFMERRYSFEGDKQVAVYPSFISLQRYEALAMSGQEQGQGMKKIRVADITTSFDQIKPYVQGDDPRLINWKATAKSHRLMLNTYTEECSQPIYCVIDKGRTMQAPFMGMTTLDYAINAALALSHIILKKGDRPGLLTFSGKAGTLIKADNKYLQLNRIAEALYNQQTHFLESDFDQLCATVSRHLHTRSLLIVFTNFDTVSGMKRRLPALKRLAAKHVLLLILFENTEINKVITQPAQHIRDIYFKAVSGSLIMEKRLMVRELEKLGIYAMLTEPPDLTAKAIKAYLTLKGKGMV